jgi:hypothetical protein
MEKRAELSRETARTLRCFSGFQPGEKQSERAMLSLNCLRAGRGAARFQQQRHGPICLCQGDESRGSN